MLNASKHRVTLETVGTVLTYVLPSVQRTIDLEHVERMVADQIEEYSTQGCFSLLQSITVADMGGELFVLDGQHRIRVYEQLVYKGLPLQNVIVPVVHYSVNSHGELLAYYNKINQHVPIHPLELRGDDVSRPFVEWMTRTFGAYLKKEKEGGNVRCPHLGLSHMKSELLARISDLTDIDIMRLFRTVTAFNAEMSRIAESCRRDYMFLPEAMTKRFADCSAKKADVSCYLGVFRRFEWLDVCLASAKERHEDVTKFNAICMILLRNQSQSAKRSGIPFHVRQLVWRKVNEGTSTIGRCYACDEVLKLNDMECGHVVAHALGGTTDTSNLMPVCRMCNRDMGIQNLELYRARIREMKD